MMHLGRRPLNVTIAPYDSKIFCGKKLLPAGQLLGDLEEAEGPAAHLLRDLQWAKAGQPVHDLRQDRVEAARLLLRNRQYPRLYRKSTTSMKHLPLGSFPGTSVKGFQRRRLEILSTKTAS